MPALTEFHHIKTNNKYGIDGSNVNYALDLRPDVRLSRTTVRKKLDTDPLLVRAVNITSELLQIGKFHPQYIDNGLLCTPKELYDDIKAMGYDWDTLLNTRGWWTPDQYKKDILQYLSTIDLLKMRKGMYVPYWLSKEDKDKIKKVN